jgi:potassium uptake protein trkH
MKAGGKVIDDNIVSSVFVMAFGFLLAIMLFTLIISMTGVDFVTALGAVAGNITNSGLGLTEATGPAGSFAGFTPFVKYILSFVMVLGRLEVIAVFVLLRKIHLM